MSINRCVLLLISGYRGPFPIQAYYEKRKAFCVHAIAFVDNAFHLDVNQVTSSSPRWPGVFKFTNFVCYVFFVFLFS